MSISSQQSSPKRPRLSLKIAGTGSGNVKSLNGVDISSPTAFNTLSNAYAAAIENASPRSARPPASALSEMRPSSLRLITNASSQDSIVFPSQRTRTPEGFSSSAYPATPIPEKSTSSLANFNPDARDSTELISARPVNSASSDKTFCFSSDAAQRVTKQPYPRKRAATLGSADLPPYTHPLALRSILRNSPLPRKAHRTVTQSPSRMSQRIANQSIKRVGYNNPLTQTITTNKYVKSHADLLMEDASPNSANESEIGSLDLKLAYSGDETRDGGQTPGPFEEMRRRMAGLGDENVPEAIESDTGSETRKRKRKEKPRRWVWTIGLEDDTEETRSPRTARSIGSLRKSPIQSGCSLGTTAPQSSMDATRAGHDVQGLPPHQGSQSTPEIRDDVFIEGEMSETSERSHSV